MSFVAFVPTSLSENYIRCTRGQLRIHQKTRWRFRSYLGVAHGTRLHVPPLHDWPTSQQPSGIRRQRYTAARWQLERASIPYFNGAKVTFQRTTIVFYYDGGRNEHNTAAVELWLLRSSMHSKDFPVFFTQVDQNQCYKLSLFTDSIGQQNLS